MKRALCALLLACAGVPALAQGVALYAQHCAACHQGDGSGTVGLAPSLKGEHWARLGADKSYTAAVLLHGLSGPIVVNGQRFVGSMPGFAAQLDDESLAALASHLSALQGGSTRYSASDIQAVRQAGGSPPQSRERRSQLLK
jgi:mono/diheme cytochrome c family protein